ncbi:Fur family transcriptional regulator [Streptomyces sp. NPDC052013]|uniref:Fur family transcriptional regulator n=1 Tax=Streptomyces sp. NPDC052013 TaxID=3365679 RepID=UPI0037CF7468
MSKARTSDRWNAERRPSTWTGSLEKAESSRWSPGASAARSATLRRDHPDHPARAAVLEGLADCQDFVSAQEVHARLTESGTRIGLTTAYRTLRGLAAAGGVDVVRYDSGERLYRRRPDDAHQHYLIRRACGHSRPVDSAVVDEWADAVAADTGSAAGTAVAVPARSCGSNALLGGLQNRHALHVMRHRNSSAAPATHIGLKINVHDEARYENSRRLMFSRTGRGLVVRPCSRLPGLVRR